MKNKQSTVILTLFLAVITLPVIWGWISSGEYVFGGFIANPLDGQTYLAKMNEGFNGDWLFHLSFTPHPGDGQPLFLLYILLGHLSKIINVPLVTVFHGARILSALFLAYSLRAFLNKMVPNHLVVKTWGLLLFGSGMGWVLLFFYKGVPVDFFVAEMYPFLSSYTNPHFPLGLGILLWLFIESYDYGHKWSFIFLFITGILLSIILQFGIVLFLGVYGICYIWGWLKKEKLNWQPIWAIFLGGGLLVLYQFYIIRTDPILVVWDAQNITPAPDILYLVMGLFPLILLVTIGFTGFVRKVSNPYIRLLLVWLTVGFLITYIPFNLQRRFLTGIYIPLAILAVIALDNFQIKRSWKTALYRAVICVVIISNLFLVIMGISALNQKESLLFLNRSEYNGLLWVRDHQNKNSVILASPELSAFIPGISETRVVYGHPYETLDAESQKARVEKFYRGEMGLNEQDEFLRTNQIKYIIYGPRERIMGSMVIGPKWNLVYTESDFIVYENKN